MPDAEVPHSVLVKTEPDTVIANPQAEGASHVAVKGRDIASTRPGVMHEDSRGARTISTAEAGFGFVEPLDTVWRL